MASCQTTRWVSTAPYVKLTVTESAVDGDTSRLSWTLQYIADYAAETSVTKPWSVTIAGATASSGSFAINGKTGTHTVASGTKDIAKGTAAKSVAFGVTFTFGLTWSGVYKNQLSASGSISVPAKTSYTVSYNANGGSGAPSAQTKWFDTALTLSSTKPTRTGYTFQGWATSASGGVAYAAGASYTANAKATLYAVWKANTYTVTYNANGGTGAPANQTKTYGVTLALSSTIPTRTNYNFLGWSTSATSTTVSYAAGANYTANAPITLYAVWELAYVKPSIDKLKVTRHNSNYEDDENGTFARVEFEYKCDRAVVSATIAWSSPSGSSGSLECDLSETYVDETIGGEPGSTEALSTEATYTITITVTDEVGYSVVFATLTGTQFAVDFLAGGKGAAFGKPAELEGVLDIGFKTRHLGGILPPLLEAETDLNNVLIPNTYTGENISHYNYLNCPVSSGTFTLLVESCGEDGQLKQTYTSCSKYKPERFSRFYYQGSWGDWFWANTDEVVLYENESGSTGTISLSAAASYYRYIEIYFTDNNGITGGYTKVWQPSGKTVALSIVEASSTIYSRQTTYAISGTSITPATATASYFRITSAGAVSTSIGTNYIKIVRVVGRA